ncbi:MFS transporter [Paraoerskovia sediminicola]|uniref:MFS transporter n=1 Tax=Paraoerskovia sediminicola TaxID=1138587 RepID=A0ABM8G2A1_9CELL|nr:DHA2 family efflux MFS transporter permease subunit [Paraoerskovia sediminicola]BDZ42241.1 MFS transporter [Paraoerskovia sediminicola]
MAHAPAEPTANRRQWFALVFISIAVSLIIVDSTIVNVAIPSIVDELDISSTQVQWVQEAYTLVFASLLLVFGGLADRVGRRRMLLAGVVVFTLASVGAALAPNGGILIAIRFVQGVGGAMVLPTTLSIINATFRGRDRGIAFAVWGSTIGGMAAVGPLLGGWLTTDFSWRWAFGINVPLGIVILAGVWAFVDESRSDDERRIDRVGALLSVLTAGTLVFGLIEGRSLGWWAPEDGLSFLGGDWPLPVSPIPLFFLASAVSCYGFVAWSRHRARHHRSTMLPLDLFTIPSFRNGNIAALVVSLGEFGIILSLPIWLQNARGYDALQTGYVLLGLAIGSFVASGAAGALSNRMEPVWMVRIGILAEIVGVAGIGSVLAVDAPWAGIVGFLFVYGFGVGMATAQLTGVILKDVPVEESGLGSGTQSTSRQLGSALGIAILGTVLFTTTGSTLDTRLDDMGVPPAQADQAVTAVVDSSGGAIAGLDADPATQPVAEAARESLTDGARWSAYAAAGFLLLGLAATFSLGSGGRREDRGGDEDSENEQRRDARAAHRE